MAAANDRDMHARGLLAIAVCVGCEGSSGPAPIDDTGDTTAGASSTGGAAVPEPSSGAVDDTTTTATGGPSSSSSTEGTSEADSAATFGVDLCGDGQLDPGEECDDDNTNDGDACSADCTLPFDVSWTIAHDGGADAQDRAFGVLARGDGYWVVGHETPPSGIRRLWLQQYEQDGAPGTVFVSNGVEGLGARGAALVSLPGGDLVVVGGTDTAETGADVLVMRIDPGTQTSTWAEAFDGDGVATAPTDADFGRRAALDPDGNIVVVGGVSGASDGRDVWVAELTPVGVLVWSQTWSSGRGIDELGVDVDVRDDGRVEVLTLECEMLSPCGARVLAFDDDGVPLPDETVVLGPTALRAMTPLEDGQRMAAGTSPGLIVGAILDASWATDWTAAGPPGEGFAAAGAEAGIVYVAGQSLAPGEQRAWLGAFRQDRSLAWSDEYVADAENSLAAWFDLTVDEAGDLIVVGETNTQTGQSNALIRKYHPH